MTQQNFTEEHNGMQVRTKMQDLQELTIFQLPEKPTIADRLRVAKEMSRYVGPTQPCNMHMDKTFSVVGVIAHPAELVDMNTGDVRQATRTIFLLEDGERLSGTSEALHRFAKQMLLPVLTETGEYGPLVAPVKVRFSRQHTKNGHGTYAPQVVE